jgi:hypothetical protein
MSGLVPFLGFIILYTGIALGMYFAFRAIKLI